MYISLYCISFSRELKDYSVKKLSISNVNPNLNIFYIYKTIYNTHSNIQYAKKQRAPYKALVVFYARFSFNQFVIVSSLKTSKRLSSHTLKLFKLFAISNSFDFTLFASINLQYPSVALFKFS